jgi:hypothetical protein
MTHRWLVATRGLVTASLVVAPVAVLLASSACGSRQHIPLDAPQYEDPVGPLDASVPGTPNHRS